MTKGIIETIEMMQKWTEDRWCTYQNEVQKEGHTAKDFYEYLDEAFDMLISATKKIK